MVVIMSERDKLFQQFGPILLEAFCEMILSEINILRTRAGLPPRTKQQVIEEINNHLSTLEPYDWMNNEGEN